MTEVYVPHGSEDVHVKDADAWNAIVQKILQTKAIHPVDHTLYPEGIGPTLVSFMSRFATTAQKWMSEGQSFTSFAKYLMQQTEVSIGDVGNQGVYATCRVLGEHWVHGDEILAWFEAGLK